MMSFNFKGISSYCTKFKNNYLDQFALDIEVIAVLMWQN